MASVVPRYLPAGDRGLVVEFGSEIDAQINRRVVALDEALSACKLKGIQECIPTYRSLLILFDPVRITRDELIRCVQSLEATESHETQRSRWVVPVLYGGAAGVDLDLVASTHGIRPRALVELHSAAEYSVHMIGFAPGFAYLGGLPKRLHTSRRSEPRARIPGRSISIGGSQTAISPPVEMPSGWHLLGRTPLRSFDLGRGADPFLFRAGDTVRFQPVSEAEYTRLDAAAAAGARAATRETTPSRTFHD